MLTQPKVPPAYALLRAAHKLPDGLLVDLYGTFDSDGCEVCDITLAGDKASLYELVPVRLLERLSQELTDAMPPKPRYQVRRELAAAYGGNPALY
jgi:hypothetical protein